VKALDDVHFDLKHGEIHALIGENGAGKSTLIKVITGVYQPDAGQIIFDGAPVEMRSTADSQRIGIAAIYQHVTCYPDLSVFKFDKGNIADWKTVYETFSTRDISGASWRALRGSLFFQKLVEMASVTLLRKGISSNSVGWSDAARKA